MPKETTERLKECMEIRKQLDDFGIMILPEVQDLITIMNDFVRDGVSSSGNIFSETIERNIIYVFSNQNHITSHIILKKIKTKA
uniref:Uncharacterized protein n=1 Tax=viral metagenome TaxID=1070528 RepID=A0A6C0KX05_9ZZZZ